MINTFSRVKSEADGVSDLGSFRQKRICNFLLMDDVDDEAIRQYDVDFETIQLDDVADEAI